MNAASTNGIHYEIAGPAGAPAVMLLHSLGSDLHMWDEQFDALAADFRVVRYDARGHGGSIAPPGEYTLRQLAEDAVDLMDSLKLEHAYLCGLSLGGITALAVAAWFPDRVRGVIAANTAAKIGTAQGWETRIDDVRNLGLEGIADATMARWFTGAFRQHRAERVSEIRKIFCSTSPVGYVGCCSVLANADLRQELTRITSPVTVICGTADAATTPADARIIAQGVRGPVRFLELPSAHLSNIECAPEFTSSVRETLIAT